MALPPSSYVWAPRVLALYAMRDAALDQLCAHAGACQGLAQAARTATKLGLIDATLANKLVKLDYSYNLVRHLTQSHADSFVSMLAALLPAQRTAAQYVHVSEAPPLEQLFDHFLDDHPANAPGADLHVHGYEAPPLEQPLPSAPEDLWAWCSWF